MSELTLYNKLSSSYDKMYKQNIQNFQDRLEKSWEGDGWFVDFYPSFGTKQIENCDLLFMAKQQMVGKMGLMSLQKRLMTKFCAVFWHQIDTFLNSITHHLIG